MTKLTAKVGNSTYVIQYEDAQGWIVIQRFNTDGETRLMLPTELLETYAKKWAAERIMALLGKL